MTALTEREQQVTIHPTTTAEPGTSHRGQRGMGWLVAVLVVAVAGLGAWAIYGAFSGSETAPTDEIDQLMDDYMDAWNDYDGDAFLQVVSDDYVLQTEGDLTGAAAQATYIDQLGTYNWQVTPVGDRMMAGDGPWYVTQVNVLESSIYAGEVEGITVLTIVDEDGVLRVAGHTYFGDL